LRGKQEGKFYNKEKKKIHEKRKKIKKFLNEDEKEKFRHFFDEAER